MDSKRSDKRKSREIKDYDDKDTVGMIDPTKPLSLDDLGFKLPPTPPTQVVSIRLPTAILNQLRAWASTRDIPYQAVIKMVLSRFVSRKDEDKSL